MKKLLIIFFLILLLFGVLVVINNYSDDYNLLEDNAISVNELEQTLSSSDEDFFVYFHQTDCIYCKNTTPIINTIIDEMKIDIKVVNLQEEPIGWDKFLIDGTPTIIHYQSGEEFSRIYGQQTEGILRNFFKNN